MNARGRYALAVGSFGLGFACGERRQQVVDTCHRDELLVGHFGAGLKQQLVLALAALAASAALAVLLGAAA